MKYQWGNHYFRHNGAGEMLTFLVADFEDFRLPRSDLPAEMEDDLEGVVRILVQNRWPSDGLLLIRQLNIEMFMQHTSPSDL